MATVGQPFYYNPPAIGGYSNMGSSHNPIASVQELNNQIIFFYTKDVGHLKVIAYVDINSNGIYNQGEEIGSVSRTLAINEVVSAQDENAPTEDEIPNLINYMLVADSGLASSQEYNGIDAVMLTYRYTHKTRKVIVEAADHETGVTIGVLAPRDYEVGKAYEISNPTVQDITALSGYTLVDSVFKTLTVSNDSTNDIHVKFNYQSSNVDGVVEVIAYEIEGGKNVEMQRYSDSYSTKYPVDITAPIIEGWSLVNPAISKITVTPNKDAVTQVYFLYEKNMYTITVKFKDVNGNMLSPPLNYNDVINVSPNADYTVYAPHVPGYKLKSPIEGSIAFSQVNQNVQAEFVFDKIEFFTVRGVTLAGENLYTVYEPYVFNSGDITVELIEFDGYVPLAGQNTVFKTDGTVHEIIFRYNLQTVFVTVNRYDGRDTSELLQTDQYEATVGETFIADTSYEGYHYVSGQYEIVVQPLQDRNVINLHYVSQAFIDSVDIVVSHISQLPNHNSWKLDTEFFAFQDLIFVYNVTNSVKVAEIKEKGYNLTTRDSEIRINLLKPVLPQTEPDLVDTPKLTDMELADIDMVDVFDSADSNFMRSESAVTSTDLRATVTSINIYYEPQLVEYSVLYINDDDNEIMEMATLTGYIGTSVQTPDVKPIENMLFQKIIHDEYISKNTRVEVHYIPVDDCEFCENRPEEGNNNGSGGGIPEEGSNNGSGGGISEEGNNNVSVPLKNENSIIENNLESDSLEAEDLAPAAEEKEETAKNEQTDNNQMERITEPSETPFGNVPERQHAEERRNPKTADAFSSNEIIIGHLIVSLFLYFGMRRYKSNL